MQRQSSACSVSVLFLSLLASPNSLSCFSIFLSELALSTFLYLPGVVLSALLFQQYAEDRKGTFSSNLFFGRTVPFATQVLSPQHYTRSRVPHGQLQSIKYTVFEM
eukprot:c27378_g1_i1 orf=17-334(+)